MPRRADARPQPPRQHRVVLGRVHDVGRAGGQRQAVAEPHARGGRPGRERRVAVGHLAAVHGHAAHDLALLLVQPDVLLEVELVRIGEEARTEVDGVVGPRAGDVDVAAGEWVDGEGCHGEAGVAGGEREVAWESWICLLEGARSWCLDWCPALDPGKSCLSAYRRLH